MTADDLLELGIIDNIIKEPVGGAHRNKEEAIANVKSALKDELKKLSKLSKKQVKEKRLQKFENMTRR